MVNLQVVESNEQAVQLRALVSAPHFRAGLGPALRGAREADDLPAADLCNGPARAALPSSSSSNGRAAPLECQNIPLLLAGFSGISWMTSQCSTILPFSSRKMSTIATRGRPGSRTPWTCRMT